MPLLYHAYVYLEFLILACTIYILAPFFLWKNDKGGDIIYNNNVTNEKRYFVWELKLLQVLLVKQR